MNPRRRTIGRIAKVLYRPNIGPDVIDIDPDTLLTRLLFFDKFVLDSVNLGELPHLIKLFGIEGFIELIKSDILDIRYETTSVITDLHLGGRRHLPLLQFSQALVSGANRSDDIE